VNIKTAIAQLTPYYPKLVEASIRLDANEQNESLEGLLSSLKEVELHRYPMHQDQQLIDALTLTYGYQPDTLILGSGSSECLDLIIKTYLNPDDALLTVSPTFVMFERYSRLANGRYLSVKESSDTVQQLVSKAKDVNPKIIMLANPNNPTGTYISMADIRTLIQSLPKTIIVIDEAYIEFVPGCPTLASWVQEFPNLIVTRTFSKAWGLASLRLGYLIAQPQRIADLLVAKTPYSIPTLSNLLGLKALAQVSMMEQRVKTIIELRTQFETLLRDVKIRYTPSFANFVYIQEPRFNLYEALLKRGILIRQYDQGTYRISIGTPREMKTVMTSIKEIYHETNI
jgi:histidinol-phosphate aminotransferase